MRDEYGHLAPGEYNAATGQPLDGRTPPHDWSEFDHAFGPRFGPGSVTSARPAEPLMTGTPLTPDQQQAMHVQGFGPSTPIPAYPVVGRSTDPYVAAQGSSVAPGGYGGSYNYTNAAGGESRGQYMNLPGSMEALKPGFSQMTPQGRANAFRSIAGQAPVYGEVTPTPTGGEIKNPYGQAVVNFGPSQTARPPSVPLSPADVAGFNPVAQSTSSQSEPNPAFVGGAAAASSYAGNRNIPAPIPPKFGPSGTYANGPFTGMTPADAKAGGSRGYVPPAPSPVFDPAERSTPFAPNPSFQTTPRFNPTEDDEGVLGAKNALQAGFNALNPKRFGPSGMPPAPNPNQGLTGIDE